jgi:hypothetical protein
VEARRAQVAAAVAAYKKATTEREVADRRWAQAGRDLEQAERMEKVGKILRAEIQRECERVDRAVEDANRALHAGLV